MDILVLFIAFILAYAFFRSQGGDGLGIRFQPPDATTAKGKRFWIEAFFVISVLVAALALRTFSNPSNTRFGLVMLPIIGGSLVYSIFLLLRKK